MRSLLEKAIVHLLNEENGKAEELFHKFLVARARQIHEDVRQGDDEALTKDWDAEENFSADDLSGAEGDEVSASADLDDADADLGDADADLDDADADLDDADDLDAAADDLEGDLGGEEGVEDRLDDIEGRFDSIQDHLDALTAQFDEIMGDDAEVDGDLDGDVEGDDAFGSDDAELDGGEFGDTSDDATDLDGKGDFGKSEDDEDEFDEGFDDITESLVDELEKISVDGRSQGKEAAAGKSVSQNTTSNLPGKKANPGDAKPVMTKSTNNDSFERETAPGTKPVPVKARNQRKTSKEGMSTVQKQGDGKALLNKDFAGKK